MASVLLELEQEERYLKLQNRERDAADALHDSLKALGAMAVSRAAAQGMEGGWAQEGTTTCERGADW